MENLFQGHDTSIKKKDMLHCFLTASFKIVFKASNTSESKMKLAKEKTELLKFFIQDVKSEHRFIDFLSISVTKLTNSM
jgi:hypothetical protein